MIEDIKIKIKQQIEETFKIESVVVEEPKKGIADLAIPLFAFAKTMQKSPVLIAKDFEDVIKDLKEIHKLEFINGFLNIFLERKGLSTSILNKIKDEQHDYGKQVLDHIETVAMDYSSPNIAKSFSVGHLRSTMIGNALKNIYQKLGYRVVGINHLGDWGTQFGKMIVAYEKWGHEEEVRKNPIQELQKLYLKFHDEEKIDPTLEQQARDVFRLLELKDEKYTALWQWFKEVSLREFMAMYHLLGVSFDSYDGESFYNDKMDAAVLELEAKGLLKIDDGATIVDLGESLPPALIKRTDGATLYITRDLAAILYRHRTYQANKVLYIVGNEQQLHFKQLKALTDLLGYHFDIEHVNFGLVLIDGKKMSTRSGKFARLEDVINQAIFEAKEAIIAKNPNLSNQDHVAKAVGIGAIIFNDLKNERHLDIEFNLENMLRFEGQTGPYLQYSSVRIESMIKEETIDLSKVSYDVYQEDHYFDIIKLLDQFPSVIQKAKETNSPNVIARYILLLAQSFNSFYGKQRIIVEDIGQKQANLLFVQSIQTVLNEGLRLLGIESLKEM